MSAISSQTMKPSRQACSPPCASTTSTSSSPPTSQGPTIRCVFPYILSTQSSHIAQVIVSEAGRVKSDVDTDQERFPDPKSKTSFSFDHLRLVRLLCSSMPQTALLRDSTQEASDPQPYEPDELSEPFRLSAFHSSFQPYLHSHCSVEPARL